MLSRSPDAAEWPALYEICSRQNVAGIGFVAIQRLPSRQWPPRDLIMRWTAVADIITRRNLMLNRECAEVCRQLTHDRFNCCILKGQSNYEYYPESLRNYRTPGDIDVLVRPAIRVGSKDIRHCVDYCRKQARRNAVKAPRVCYHHTEMAWNGGIEVELHYRATWLCSPLRNMLLQRWLDGDEQWITHETVVDGGMLVVPSIRYNAVYQLLHIYKHLFDSGVTLRQVMDYYYVLRTFADEIGSDNVVKDNVMSLLRSFGLERFAGAMMWVLAMVFCNVGSVDVPAEWHERWPWMLCSPDDVEGRFLLDEMMFAGDFGRYDRRLSHSSSQSGRVCKKLCRSMRLLGHYPEEAASMPFFMAYHWLWRKLKLWML